MKRIQVTDVPARLRKKLAADIRRQHTSLNDLCAGILSARYGVEHTPSRMRARKTPDEGRIILKISDALYEAIRDDAFSRRSTMAGTIVVGLTTHYYPTKEN